MTEREMLEEIAKAAARYAMGIARVHVPLTELVRMDAAVEEFFADTLRKARTPPKPWWFTHKTKPEGT